MGRRWTEYEEAWLAQVWPKTDIPSKAIAHALKRTVAAIRQRAAKLGIGRPWNGSPEQLKQWKLIQEAWIGSPENLEVLKRAREIAHKTWLGSPEQLKQFKRTREKGREKLRVKPTWPEARFYGLVYGYDGLAKEFHAQELIPTTVCNHTVDGRWRTVIFELDGGGHNIYRDVTEHDSLVDTEYQKMGYQVVREKTASELFLRLLQIVKKSNGEN